MSSDNQTNSIQLSIKIVQKEQSKESIREVDLRKMGRPTKD